MRKNDILDGKKRDSAHNGVEIAAKATEKTREGQEWWEGDPVMANIHAGPEYIKLELRGKVDFAVREAFGDVCELLDVRKGIALFLDRAKNQYVWLQPNGGNNVAILRDKIGEKFILLPENVGKSL